MFKTRFQNHVTHTIHGNNQRFLFIPYGEIYCKIMLN